MEKYKKYLLFGCMAFWVMQPPPAFSAEAKIATVDLSRAFDAFEKTKESDKILEAKGQDKKAERDEKVAEIKKLKGELDLLNEKGKREKQAIIDRKVRELQDFDREVRDGLRGERDQMVREILKDIDQVIQDYGRENKHTLILNDRVLLYKDDTLDVTDEIIKRLNPGKKGKKGKKR